MPAPRTPTKGRTEQHMADAPFEGRGTSAASVLQGPFGPGWSFSRKQLLDATRRLIVSRTLVACGLLVIYS